MEQSDLTGNLLVGAAAGGATAMVVGICLVVSLAVSELRRIRKS